MCSQDVRPKLGGMQRSSGCACRMCVSNWGACKGNLGALVGCASQNGGRAKKLLVLLQDVRLKMGGVQRSSGCTCRMCVSNCGGCTKELWVRVQDVCLKLGVCGKELLVCVHDAHFKLAGCAS